MAFRVSYQTYFMDVRQVQSLPQCAILAAVNLNFVNKKGPQNN